MALIVGTNTYITEAEADDFFEGVINGDTWVSVSTDDKERYIRSAYVEIQEEIFESDASAKRKQLRILEILFFNYDDFVAHKVNQVSGLKRYKNSKLEVEYSEAAGGNDLSNGANDGDFDNQLVDLF